MPSEQLDNLASGVGAAASSKSAANQRPRRSALARLEGRFLTIWIALGILLVADAIFLPKSLDGTTLLAVSPFSAFLAIAAIGQATVIMARGIDLSAPAIITLSSSILIGVSGGSDERLWIAVVAALLGAVFVGTINGLSIVFLKLNALIVTLAVGAIVTGLTIWYRQSFGAESPVPPSLAEFGNGRIFGVPTAVAIASVITLIAVLLLTKTVWGRKFEASGCNPDAAFIIGINVKLYQAGAYAIAGLIYGIAAVLLAGFIGNPTLDAGNPYFMAPIAAAVLGGVAMTGGIGNMLSVSIAAIFLIQLDQSLKMLGLPTSWQLVIQGVAIGAGMWLSEITSTTRRG
ncbi:ABC transporter permease [Rhizobium sp. YTU87027]|uniref:ABC transporter permease n=1 Tax=Rhizobium sp. YTU87027 TaxID=3417741 RepID=UPI003D69C427